MLDIELLYFSYQVHLQSVCLLKSRPTASTVPRYYRPCDKITKAIILHINHSCKYLPNYNDLNRHIAFPCY